MSKPEGPKDYEKASNGLLVFLAVLAIAICLFFGWAAHLGFGVVGW